MPADGESVGEFEVRGPWVTGRLLRRPRSRPVPRRLAADRRRREPRRPGLHADLGPDQGRHQVRGRVDLVGRARERGDGPSRGLRGRRHRRARRHGGTSGRSWWSCRAKVPGPSPGELLEFLSSRVARWWLPERWAFVDEIPKTSVGKFDKKVLRAQVADGTLEIHEVGPARHATTAETHGHGRRGAGRRLDVDRRGARRPGLRPAARGAGGGAARRRRPTPPSWPRSGASPGPVGLWRRPWWCCGDPPADTGSRHLRPTTGAGQSTSALRASISWRSRP